MAHNSQLIRLFLDVNFLDRSIGTRGPVSVLDYFSVWGYFQDITYGVQHNTLHELKIATVIDMLYGPLS